MKGAALMMGKQEAHWAIMAAWGIGLTTCLLLPLTWAEDAPAAGDDESWKAERTKLEEVIAQRLKEEVDKNAKKQDVAAKLGFKWPVLAPPKKKEEVEADVEKQLEEIVATQFPEARRKEFEKDAATKYRMCKVGDDVSFSIRGGKGPNAAIKGHLQEQTKQRIKTSGRYVLRSDMDPETQALFWEDVNDEFRKNYIRVQNTQYDAKITAFKDEQREIKLPEALRTARYVHVQNKQLLEVLKAALNVPEPAKGANKKLTEWFAESEVLDFFHKKQVDIVEAKAKPEITEQVFVSNGYELVEDTEKNTKEWMPKKQALTFRERLKEMIEKKKQDELEAGAKQDAADPWGAGTPAAGQPAGGPGMMMGPGQPGAGGQPGMMMGPGQPGAGGQPGMMMGPGQPGAGGQPGMMMGPGQPGAGGQPGMMMGPGQPGMGQGQPGMMMGPGQPGAGAAKPAAGAAKPAGEKNPFDNNQ
jgi:hypothetical protein